MARSAELVYASVRVEIARRVYFMLLHRIAFGSFAASWSVNIRRFMFVSGWV